MRTWPSVVFAPVISRHFTVDNHVRRPAARSTAGSHVTCLAFPASLPALTLRREGKFCGRRDRPAPAQQPARYSRLSTFLPFQPAFSHPTHPFPPPVQPSAPGSMANGAPAERKISAVGTSNSAARPAGPPRSRSSYGQQSSDARTAPSKHSTSSSLLSDPTGPLTGAGFLMRPFLAARHSSLCRHHVVERHADTEQQRSSLAELGALAQGLEVRFVCCGCFVGRPES